MAQVTFPQKYLQSHMWPSYIVRISGRSKNLFTENGEVSFKYLKTFVATRCFTLSFVGSQFTSINYLAPVCYLESSLKQKRIHLF